MLYGRWEKSELNKRAQNSNKKYAGEVLERKWYFLFFFFFKLHCIWLFWEENKALETFFKIVLFFI